MKTRSLSTDEISKYCSGFEHRIRIEKGAFDFANSAPATLILRAPTEGRQMLIFVICLVDILMEGDAPGLVRFGRFDVGALNSGNIGQRVIHDLRLAQADARSLQQARVSGLKVEQKKS